MALAKTLESSYTEFPETKVDPAKVRRAAWAGLAGTTLEQYDFVIYGTASALILASCSSRTSRPRPA